MLHSKLGAKFIRRTCTHLALLQVASDTAHRELESCLRRPGDGLLGTLTLSTSAHDCTCVVLRLRGGLLEQRGQCKNFLSVYLEQLSKALFIYCYSSSGPIRAQQSHCTSFLIRRSRNAALSLARRLDQQYIKVVSSLCSSQIAIKAFRISR